MRFDNHAAHQMLGEVDHKESMRDVVDSLLGRSGLKEWTRYSRAALTKRKVTRTTAQVWATQLSHESERWGSSQVSEPSSKK